MDRFRSLEVFAATAERLSFAAAARDLKFTARWCRSTSAI
jgi:DNA-binding transcriptional LysR family regulator